MAAPVAAALGSLARQFRATAPLPGFAVVDGFFDESFTARLERLLDDARYATHCVWSAHADGSDLQSGPREPDEHDYFLSIHERPQDLTPIRSMVEPAMLRSGFLHAMSVIAGRPLERIDGAITATRWSLGHFLNDHADCGPADDPVRLVVSLSLTRDWQPANGGTTTFQWRSSEHGVTVRPRFGRTVLFAPFEGSLHRVQPVTSVGSCPRYTLTVFLR